ncbi:beta-1:3-galactosyltransferase 2-like protein [Dinothrombium tinctorium]|uniref:Hexosyltransferase n=1 Tax=Dinothrombium tinctorium TaxID=1965070 RepID=A0A3S3NWK6_9ACAR|nr:beta-1:3-galactosyltransferase 2-like protein [Dinothrombium tinctorium]
MSAAKSDEASFSFFSPAEIEATKEVIIDQPFYCGKNLGKGVDLVVVVMSAIYKFSQREAIRKTWGKVAKMRGIRVLFFLGETFDERTQANVVRENELNSDIIQVAFHDHYYNNTLKAIAILRSLSRYCKKVKFVLKSDDDMLLNIQIASDFAKSNRYAKRTIFGLIYRNAAVNRSRFSKWFVPKSVYRANRYPSYATGAVYMFTGDAIEPLLNACVNDLNPLYIDDVYITGIVAQKAGVRRNWANFVKLHYADKLDAWSYATYLGTHGYDSEKLIDRWNLIHAHVKCET